MPNEELARHTDGLVYVQFDQDKD